MNYGRFIRLLAIARGNSQYCLVLLQLQDYFKQIYVNKLNKFVHQKTQSIYDWYIRLDFWVKTKSC